MTKLNHDKIWDKYNRRPHKGSNAKQCTEPQALGEMFDEGDDGTQAHVHANDAPKLTPDEEAAELAKMAPAAFERFNKPRRERS